jgi:two-component system, NtrC family, nitrogen regulation sensor histidine kinase NtrY
MASSALTTAKAQTADVSRRRVRLLHEYRVGFYSLLFVSPGIVVSGILVWLQPWSTVLKVALCSGGLVACWVLALALHRKTVRPLQTLANVVAALREGDYSFRASRATKADALGELSLEVNALADVLADQRIRAIEATALLRRVVEEIDVPLFAFNSDETLQLVNPAGENLLQQPAVRLLGRTANEIGLTGCMSAPDEALVALPANTPSARWLVRRSKFREKGAPHTLIVLADVSRALREEERSAWRRLISVIGHELNNSLAPIKSIAASLSSRLPQAGLSPEQRRDFERGLAIIEARTTSLNRFLQAYRQLAQMPPPSMKRVALLPIIERVAFLETRSAVTVHRGPEAALLVDSDQIEQMLINLVRNAVEAALEFSSSSNGPSKSSEVRKPHVWVGWTVQDQSVILTIEDNGPGLLNSSNAFVPFYTTKPNGSGIGLALSRQIAEAHGGVIELSNLHGQSGCQVRVILPCVCK